MGSTPPSSRDARYARSGRGRCGHPVPRGSHSVRRKGGVLAPNSRTNHASLAADTLSPRSTARAGTSIIHARILSTRKALLSKGIAGSRELGLSSNATSALHSYDGHQPVIGHDPDGAGASRHEMLGEQPARGINALPYRRPIKASSPGCARDPAARVSRRATPRDDRRHRRQMPRTSSRTDSSITHCPRARVLSPACSKTLAPGWPEICPCRHDGLATTSSSTRRVQTAAERYPGHSGASNNDAARQHRHTRE